MSSDRRKTHPMVAAGAVILALTAGCVRTTTDASLVETYAADELDFWETMETHRVVTNHDAIHGLLLLAGDVEPAESYEARIAQARERGWLSSSATPIANESARFGMIAVAVCDILDIKGGLSMRLFGKSPRYCTRELMDIDLIPPRTDQQSITGLEFIDLVGRVEDESRRRAGTPLRETADVVEVAQ